MKKIFTLFVFVAFASMTFAQFSVTFSVDMTPKAGFNPTTDEVYIAGDNAAIGTWTQPGTNPGYKLTRVGTTNVYSITKPGIAAGSIQFKFFSAPTGTVTWSSGEWNGNPNRLINVSATMTSNCVWGVNQAPFNTSVGNLNAADITVYPNPSNGVFNVTSNQNCNLNVIDIAGKSVYQTKLNANENTVDLSSTQAGMYFFKFTSENNSYVERVIIK